MSSETSHLPHASSIHETGSLFLSETGVPSFILGLSMLNYSIAYLCHTQGVVIGVRECVGTLEMLARVCQSGDLGSEKGVGVFALEFDEVLNIVGEVLKGETRDVERIVNIVRIRDSDELELSWDVL
jgi:hypothetical protein